MRRIISLVAIGACLGVASLSACSSPSHPSIANEVNKTNSARIVSAPSHQRTLNYYKVASRNEPVTYIVQKGQSLSSIAKAEYGRAEDWPVIFYANHIHYANNISAGQHLSIPSLPRHIPNAPRVLSPHVAVTTRTSSPAPVTSSPPAPTAPLPPVGGFEACVIQRESGGNPRAYNASSGASGLYGMLLSTWMSLGLGYSGGAYTAPVSVQHQGFEILYARDGVAPWRPYDGC